MHRSTLAKLGLATATPGYAAVRIFPDINVSTEFAVLGIEASRAGPGQTFTTDGFAVRYDASTGLYVIDLPTTGSGGFY